MYPTKKKKKGAKAQILSPWVMDTGEASHQATDEAPHQALQGVIDPRPRDVYSSYQPPSFFPLINPEIL